MIPATMKMGIADRREPPGQHARHGQRHEDDGQIVELEQGRPRDVGVGAAARRLP